MPDNIPEVPGLYLYTLPHWDSFVVVRVEGETIRFKDNLYPFSIQDIPADAIFTPLSLGMILYK